MIKKIAILFLGLIAASQGVTQDFYSLNTIQKIEISFSQSDWDYQLDVLKLGSDKYLMATWIKINGVLFDSVGVKYKGNSSYDSTFKKNPLHIELNTFKSQSYQGYTDIKLGNSYSDPSMIREVLAYSILKNYMECPEANFAELIINGKFMGIYSNAENINKKFCADRFYSSTNTFIKCNPNINPGPTVKSNLKYITADSTSYYDFYEKKSKDGWKDLVGLCDTLTNHSSFIGSKVDMDRAIWMLAFNTVLVNLDSYTGAFVQNYYLYKDNTNHFNPIVWDLNMAFGGFPFSGSPNNGMGSLSLTNMQQFPLLYHDTHVDWPLIKAVMNNATYKRMFIAHSKTILNEFFTKKDYVTLAISLQNQIDKSVAMDSSKFYSYSLFKAGLNTNVNNGIYTIPGISNLMDARTTYLKSSSEFSTSPPILSNLKTLPIVPAFNAPVNWCVKVSNAVSNMVFVGYRYDITKKFERIPMYDDGLHGDGLANDSIYGVSILMKSAYVHYYIYAENTNAAVFSPERAEHNYYQLALPTDTIKKGDLVINEFLAINDKTDLNEYGIYSDWIELYNTTNKELNLTGYFLSDNGNSFQKFAFEVNTIIAPKGYLMIWADGLKTSKTYLHSGFNLTGSSGHLFFSNSNGAIIDSVSYTNQNADISMGRCPNGSGKFTPIETPTFSGNNSLFCSVDISLPKALPTKIVAYPNPTYNYVSFTENLSQINTVEFYNSYGILIKSVHLDKNHTLLAVNDLYSGIYIYKLKDKIGTELSQGRIVIIR